MCTRDVHFSPCCGSRWLPRVGCNLAGCVRHPGLVAPELLGGGSMWTTQPTPDCLEGPIVAWPSSLLLECFLPGPARFPLVSVLRAHPRVSGGQELPCARCTGTARPPLLWEELSQQPGLRPDPTLRVTPPRVPAQSPSGRPVTLPELRQVTPARDPPPLPSVSNCGWFAGAQAPVSRTGRDVLAARRLSSMPSGPPEL